MTSATADVLWVVARGAVAGVSAAAMAITAVAAITFWPSQLGVEEMPARSTLMQASGRNVER